jgi:hypothetical protein
MKFQVIGSPEQVALVDFGGDMLKAKLACNPAEFSNTNPMTGKPFAALVAGGQIWDRKREAEQFRVRCESALAFISGKDSKWITPTFVVQPINGHLARKMTKARRASAILIRTEAAAKN